MKRISDEELFGAVPRAPALPSSESSGDTATTKAKVVLEALSAAGLQLPFGMNLDSAEQLWADELGDMAPQDLSDAVEQWIGGTDARFPTVGEIAFLARQAKAARIAMRPQDCTACGGSRYIDCPPGEGGRVNASSPCPDCNEVQYSWVRDGHSSWKHTRVSCGHPLCVHMSGRDRAKAKKR